MISEFWHGAKSPKIVFVNDVWRREETELGLPLIGPAGREFFRMLGQAWKSEEISSLADDFSPLWGRKRLPWMEANHVAIISVFNFRPERDEMESLCGEKDDPESSEVKFPNETYLKTRYQPHLERLIADLNTVSPNLIVPLGLIASWALRLPLVLKKTRGAVTQSPGVKAKILPTYSPASLLFSASGSGGNWSNRPVIIADLIKARVEMRFSEVRRMKREIVVNPTLASVEKMVESILAFPPPQLSIDIETGRGQIRCVGIATSINFATIIPFTDNYRRYWPTIDEEFRAWNSVKALCESLIPKIGQNFLYDIQWLMKMGIYMNCAREDTMLQSHAIWPELPKDLGFLGSVFANEPAWKMMRDRRGASAEGEKPNE